MKMTAGVKHPSDINILLNKGPFHLDNLPKYTCKKFQS